MSETDSIPRARRKIALDFAAFWDEHVRRDPANRLNAEDDVSFWAQHAPLYDQRAGAPGSATRTLQLIRQHLRPSDTLLDIGAGTGRFAIPLSHYVRQVTAVDHSPEMLEILNRKAHTRNIHNIQAIQADWSSLALEPHDVVLAAWSLYQQSHLLTALQRLLNATRRRLFIVAEVKSWPLPHLIAMRIWPEHYANEVDVPMHLSYLGALWQLGAHADLRIVNETRVFFANTPAELATLFAPRHASASEIDRFAADLTPQLKRSQGGYIYSLTEPVAVILWRANQPYEHVPASSD
ncbi:MAG: class I SAM-dependent methyltransferase [Candidatus Roseilinea sp.]|uniref:class I SAM-dependent methyltransferase n=1 Tax=Candidatus Roseilinea sp. TaxID=2838777 RepID=UPI00404B939C